jgi:SAM-dependent MidA family methyltransferase
MLEEIRHRLESDTPLFFDEFMSLALYGPEGYFTTGGLRSVQAGDFLTSPEVSHHFGRTLAEFIRREQHRLGEPAGFRLVEAGAGSGSLLGPLLEEIVMPAWAVEVSPAAQTRLGRIPGVEMAGSLEQVPIAPGVVLANELLDNLPLAIAVKSSSGWDEQVVVGQGEGLGIELVPARAAVAAWAAEFGGKRQPGDLVEVQIEAGEWLTQALAVTSAGTVVVIDYGGTIDELEPRRQTGTLRTYRAHHLGPDPLLQPGETDITADVNFTALVTAAEEAGAEVGLSRQDDFLAGLGLREKLSGLRRRELELARAGDELERLRVRSEKTGIETLLHPRGLGDFRVLVARK